MRGMNRKTRSSAGQSITSLLRLSVLNSSCLSKMLLSTCIRDTTRRLVHSIFQVKKIDILVLGLPQTGKTTLCLKLMGSKDELPDCIFETSGQCVRPLLEFKKTYHFKRTKVCFSELGHVDRNIGPTMPEQSLNPEYFYSRAHGIIYVMDVSRPERIEQAKDEIHKLLTNDFIRGKPVLIFGTRANDLSSGCFGPTTLTTEMGLRPLSRLTKSIFLLSLVDFDADRKEISASVKWLINIICDQHKELIERISNEALVYGEKQRVRDTQINALKTASSNLTSQLKVFSKTNKIMNYSSKPEVPNDSEDDKRIGRAITYTETDGNTESKTPFILTHPISPFYFRQSDKDHNVSTSVKRDTTMKIIPLHGSGDRLKANGDNIEFQMQIMDNDLFESEPKVEGIMEPEIVIGDKIFQKMIDSENCSNEQNNSMDNVNLSNSKPNRNQPLELK